MKNSYRAFAPLYDRLLETVDYQKRAAYFDSIIQEYNPERKILLDLACGTGSLSFALSKLGYDVIGVDASEEMLLIAQQKMYETEERVLFLQQRMESLDLYGTIDHCVSALDSLNHLTKSAQLQRAFDRVSLFLMPGGIFVFDMNSPYKHREILADECFVYEQDGAMCVWQNHTEGLLTDISLDFFTEQSDGRYRRTGEHFAERGYEVETIEEMLTRSGLELLKLYGDDSFSPPTATTERLIYVTRKRS